MGWPVCNTTEEDMLITEDPIWHDYTFHRLGLWISAIFGLIAITVSFFLIFMHATHYLKPWEQRHIIRILFMVPVYAAVSFLSIYYYNHSVYFEVIRDCYEAFAIASFFSLLCSYLAADLHQQKIYFRTITPKKWIWPMGYLQKCTGGEKDGWLRTPRSGLTWFNVIWVAIFQYCFIRVFCTIVAVVTQAFDRYCLESLNPAFSHVWIMVIEATAVSIAMYCLIQFYLQLRHDIQHHRPLLKVLAIKLVIFLSFWQTILISFLTSSGAVKPTNHIQTPDLKVGIPAMLLCIEMALFAILHLWAFSWRPYSLTSKEYLADTLPEQGTSPTYKGGFLGVKAIFDSFNPWDIFKAVGRAAKWLWRDRKNRHHDASYASTIKPSTGQDSQGETLSTFNQPTSYAGNANRIPPSHFADSEGDTLLANSQSMPMSRPPLSRLESYRGDDDYQNNPYTSGDFPSSSQGPPYFDRGAIGVATSIYPDHGPNQYDSHKQSHNPNQSQVYGEYGAASGADQESYPHYNTSLPAQHHFSGPNLRQQQQ